MRQYQAFVFQQIDNPTDIIVQDMPVALIPIGQPTLSRREARENIINTPEIPYGASYTVLEVDNK